jgi:hypothetical protein
VATRKTVKAVAANPRAGMSLEELAVFVEEARKAAVPDGTAVRVTTTFRGTVKSLEVSG